MYIYTDIQKRNLQVYFFLKYAFLSTDYKVCFEAKRVICTLTDTCTSLAKHCWKKPPVRALAHLEGHTFAFYIGFSGNPTRINHYKACVQAQLASN